MANSPTRITDAVQVELNAPDMSQYSLEELEAFVEGDDVALAELAADQIARRFNEQQVKLSERPADKANRSAWVDYCVQLGADRDFLEKETEHYDGNSGQYVKYPSLQKQDLISLADKLGG